MVYEISQVNFRFYTPEELKKICVVQCSEPLTYDNVKQPRKGGLYDRRMGPVKRHDLCDTCGLSNKFCPGHLGYIELKTPIIHPALFSELQKVLKISCLYCQSLMTTAEKKKKYELKLRLISVGLISEAKDLFPNLTLKEGMMEKQDKEEDQMDEDAPLDKSSLTDAGKDCQSLSIEDLEKKVEKLIKKKLKTENCKTVDQLVSKLGSDPMVGIQAEKVQAVREFLEICSQESKCKNCARLPLRFTIAPNGQGGLFLKTTGKGCNYIANAPKGIPSHIAKFTDKLTNPSNVFVWPVYLRDILKMIWQNESSILDLLFGQSYEMFFLDCIPVPANRFRPTNLVNEEEMEAAQNTYYSKMISLNNDIHFDKDRKETISAKISEIQVQMNILIDASKTMATKDTFKGAKQLLERKEGLFRMNMMGKRVNYAARSIILPDPNIETDEVGIPQHFAKKLSYPEQVTSYNVDWLMKSVIQGPNNYPGANSIGWITESGEEKKYDLLAMDAAKRKDLAKKLLTGNKIVYRHVRDGDVFLVNRQPTLHRPSIMAHKARVFGEQKTIRLHYANCASYNADFDGDEMNLHLPQNEIARAEAYNLMITNNQYISPTSGFPLRGLIQDNLSSAVLLTMKDTFLSREDYHELLYGALYNHSARREIKTLAPALIKPKPLWTGKQVVSTIILHLADGRKGINVDGKSRLKATMFGHDSEEGDVIFRDNLLLCGVLDKKHFGAERDSIVHCVYECYGPETAGKLLTVLCRLCMLYLQIYGFTCGLDDLLLNTKVEKKRQQLLKEANANGTAAAMKYCKEKNMDKIKQVLSVNLSNERFSRGLDHVVKASINEKTSEIIKEAIPDGQAKPFRKNFFAQMTSSGAKGSAVNFSQVVCCLGQQEFEGRRVQPMASGKTLPSFKEFDISAMSGGFIGSRFITGIKPQEYFFHTMAGRDGLIDTAVKTARSGYLQRCLVKHLENISVQYDRTVRDNFGSVLQFDYGGDSIDTSKHAMMAQFKFLIMSQDAIKERYNLHQVEQNFKIKNHSHPKVEKQVSKGKKSSEYQSLLEKFSPDHYFGSISEKYASQINEYIEKNPDGLIGSKISDSEFRKLCHLKYMTSLVEPGEAVGVMAAQGIGEPSTQMTLNTFHSAGMDVAHVTVGIPRLRQLFMVGTVNEPIITIPVKKDSDKEKIDKIHHKLEPVCLYDVTTNVEITTCTLKESVRQYELVIELDQAKLKTMHKKEVQRGFTGFIKELLRSIKKYLGDKNRKEESDEPVTSITDEPDMDAEDSFKEKKKEHKEKKKRKHEIDPDATERDIANIKDKFDEDEDEVDSQDSQDSQEEDEEVQEEKKKKRKQADEEEKDLDINEDDTMIQKPIGKFGQLAAKNKGTSFLIQCKFMHKEHLFFSHFVEVASKKSFLRSIPDIKKAILNEKDGNYSFTVEGTNFDEVYQLDPKIIDFSNVLTNDVNKIVERYGIEAGRALIIKDAQSVFSMYGIPVNERHIGLIADYMTFLGFYKACNRHALNYRPGPWHKMTFEQSTKFLMDAAVSGDKDPVTGPSSRIIFGRLTDQGTGSFDMRLDLNVE